MASIPNLPNISLTRNQIIMIAAVAVVLVVVIILFSLGGSQDGGLSPITLKVWGFDSPEAMSPIIKGYESFRPNATIEYTQVLKENYDSALFSALASGRGPDAFMIDNHDLFSHGELITPVGVQQLPAANFQAFFPQAASNDLVYGGYPYAVPLYMDTLTLLYNKAMFDQAGIALPPQTWQEVLDVIPRLRSQNQNGQINQAAIALGGSERTVSHATDILNLIMLQNGTVMSNDSGKPTFGQGNSGIQALDFYLQFSNAASESYTWNESMGNSIESFAAQKTAMVLAYPEDIEAIRRQSPFLDLGVAPAPQLSKDVAVNYPKYHALAVWVGTPGQEWPWDFAIFAATNPDAQRQYLAATGHNPALRSLVAEIEGDPNKQVFARAVLTSRSWKMGDYDKIKDIFSTAIQNVLSGAKNPATALRDAEAQASQIVPQ